MKSAYSFIQEAWKKPDVNLLRQRMIEWRKNPSVIKLERPTRLDRARNLGYKAKQGFVIVRQRVLRGGHRREQIKGGRRSKRFGTRLNLDKNYQWIAEERAQKSYKNLVVLNSYWVAEDGMYRWFEVILVDPDHPVIKADRNLAWLQTRKNWSRVFHGKTSAGKKGRGLRS